MLKDITIGQYFPGSSPVHRMDPRFKIIMTLLFIAMLFMGQHLYSILFGVVFCILALSFSKIPVRLIWKSIKPLIPVLMITAVLDLLMVDSGDDLLEMAFSKTDRRRRADGNTDGDTHHRAACRFISADLYHIAHCLDRRH